MSQATGALYNQALDYAINTTGDYIGVVYMKPPPAFPEEPPVWKTMPPFRTRQALVDWYNGWVGSPTLYHYLAAFDKTVPDWDGDPIAAVTDRDPPVQISGGHGGRGHHGGRGRRFGGWGGGWGWDDYAPYYAPCYAYDAWGNCIDPYPLEVGMDPHALAHSIGNHRGRVYRSAPPAGQLPALAPLLTWPSAIPSRIEMSLDGHELTVAVQLDDKVYRGTADLSQVFDTARAYLTAYHEALHHQGHLLVGAAGQGPPSVADAGGVIAQDTVDRACDLLVGALCDRHRHDHAIACAGWWSDISHAVTSAAKGIEHTAEGAVKEAGKTLSALKGPIMTAAAGAAGAAALAIPGAGPLVAPLASSLAKNLVDAATGGGSVQGAAQQVVQQAAAAAQSNPQVAAALDTAHQAVVQATAGYHTAQTFANAAAGDPNAQGQVAELVNAAQAGDPAASGALDVAAATVDALPAAIDAALTPDPAAVQGWLGVLGGMLAGAGGALYGPDAWRWARDQWQRRHAAAPAAPAAHP